jgi:acetyl esterase/lipase
MDGQHRGTLPRASAHDDPIPTFELRIHDVEYRRAGAESWLARLYEPVGAGPFPGLLKVHGGGWRNLDRMHYAAVDEALAASGAVVASIDFRSSNQEPYPASMADVNYGTRWFKAHAAEFNARPDMIGGLGISSGGHLIMLSAMRPRDPRYAAIALPKGPEADANLAFVVLVCPGVDPFSLHQNWLKAGQDAGLTAL